MGLGGDAIPTCLSYTGVSFWPPAATFGSGWTSGWLSCTNVFRGKLDLSALSDLGTTAWDDDEGDNFVKIGGRLRRSRSLKPFLKEKRYFFWMCQSLQY